MDKTQIQQEYASPECAPANAPWGFRATLGISFSIIVVNFLAQFCVFIFHLFWQAFGQQASGHQRIFLNMNAIRSYIANFELNSRIISESILFPDIVCILTVIFFIRRKRGQQIREYLVLNSVSPLKFVLWQIAMIVIYYFTNYITEKMSVPQPDFMNVMRNIAASESVFNLALLAAALVLTAPLFEEIMFRGFMFTGLASSRAGVVGAAMIPALLWSLVHFQYEWIWVAIIFFMGLAFALARYTTGSIYTVFFMHAINNFLSFLEVIKTNTQ